MFFFSLSLIFLFFHLFVSLEFFFLFFVFLSTFHIMTDHQWHCLSFIVPSQWRIQDFPEEGVSTPKVGAPIYYLATIFLKTAWKWKNLDPEGGGGARPPLDPPMPAFMAHSHCTGTGTGQVQGTALARYKTMGLVMFQDPVQCERFNQVSCRNPLFPVLFPLPHPLLPVPSSVNAIIPLWQIQTLERGNTKILTTLA